MYIIFIFIYFILLYYIIMKYCKYLENNKLYIYIYINQFFFN